VGEISIVLDQSQPRISRHLKMLCDAGLLDRFREEHWVYYRVPSSGIGNELTAHLSQMIAKDDPALMADQRRMTAVLANRVKEAVMSAAAKHSDAPSAFGAGVSNVLHDAIVDELSAEPIGELLDIGTGTGDLLRTLGINSTRAVGVDISTEALRIARTRTHSAGLSHCLFRRGDMYGLPFDDESFDTVTMDRVIATADRPADAIAEGARMLRTGGRLCLVEDFDSLDVTVGGNPLAALREWLEAAQLQCERLCPIDTESGHLIIAVARASVALRQAA
jgi:ArsR family transcriptional regulator